MILNIVFLTILVLEQFTSRKLKYHPVISLYNFWLRNKSLKSDEHDSLRRKAHYSNYVTIRYVIKGKWKTQRPHFLSIKILFIVIYL
jgi:hypothetical protein